MCWMLIVTLTLQFELLCIPFVLIQPQYLQSINVQLWICDGVWVIFILLKMITIRYEIESRDSAYIVLDYVKNEFLFDIMATVPTILTFHSKSWLITRVLHIFQIKLAYYPLSMFLEIIIPNGR